jgi:autotransporter-associated beta strand protein
MNSNILANSPLALLAGATFFAGSANAANLVTNGSFEGSNTGWTGAGALYNHPYNGLAGIKLADTGGAQSTAATGNFNFNSLLYGYNDDLASPIGAQFHGLGGGTQIITNATLNTVVTNDDLDNGAAVFAFSAWLSSYVSDGNTPALRLRFFNGDNGTGTLLGTEFRLDRGTTTNQVTTAQLLATGNILNGPENSSTDPDYWALYEIKSSLPAGTRSAIIDFVSGTGHAAQGSNDWYADAIVLDVLPVPSYVWTGAASSEWSTATITSPKNWELSTAPGISVDFANLSPARFTESGTRTIAINGADVTPTSTRFEHTTGNYTITGTNGIAGSAAISLTGTGTLTLSNPNTTTGATRLDAGSLVIDHPLALQDSTLTGFFGSSTHTFGTITETTLGGLSGSADFALTNTSSAPVALTIGNNNSSRIYQGELSGAGSLTKIGTGIQTLTFSSTYTGGTTVAAGILIARVPDAFGTGTVTSTGGIIEFETGTGEATIANDFVLPAGTGAIRMFATFGSGRTAPAPGSTVRLTGKISGGDPARLFYISDTGLSGEHDNATILDNSENDFTGTVFINRATIAFTSDEALGDPENDITHFSENLNGRLRFDADNITINPLRTVNLPAPANIRPFDTQAFTGTIAGPITGTGLMSKLGTGTLILTSPDSTFTGPINLTEGTLDLQGTLPTSISSTTVTATATLTGDGTLQRPVTLTGGTIAPGSGVGTLNGITALNFSADGKYTFDLADWNGAPGTGYDTLNVDTLAITSGPAGPFVITITPQSLANFTNTQKSFVLVSTANGITGFTEDAFTIDASALPAATLGWSIQVQGNNLILGHGLPAGTPFQLWAADKGLTGDDTLFNADPDADGIPNGIEFVIGGEPNPANPNANSNTLLPSIEIDETSLRFRFHRSDDSAALNPVCEYSTTLTGWTPAQGGVDGVTIEETPNINGGDDVVVIIPITLASPDGKLFARLAVTE